MWMDWLIMKERTGKHWSAKEDGHWVRPCLFDTEPGGYNPPRAPEKVQGAKRNGDSGLHPAHPVQTCQLLSVSYSEPQQCLPSPGLAVFPLCPGKTTTNVIQIWYQKSGTCSQKITVSQNPLEACLEHPLDVSHRPEPKAK